MGLRLTLEAECQDITVAGEADCGKALFQLLASGAEADIVLLDIILPDMTGIEIASRLRAERPGLKILAISSENTREVVQQMLDIGIEGFISKRRGSTGEIADAIRSITDGLEYFGKDISDVIYGVYVARKRMAEATADFTERELEIIELCREGLSSKKIGERLFLSPRTVDNHKRQIFEKLDIHSTVELIKFALDNGIIRIEN